MIKENDWANLPDDELKRTVLEATRHLVALFLYYDRKEDEEFTFAALKRAKDLVTPEELGTEFVAELKRRWNDVV